MMKLGYDAVIFDLDGTLLDTLADLTNATNHAMRANNYPEHTADEVREYVGNGIEMLIQRALPSIADGDPEAFQETLQVFKHCYAAHNNDFTQPYAGVCDMLSQLNHAGVRLGVVSNKNDPNVKALCAHYFGPWIHAAVGERDGVRRKPAPDTLLQLMDILQAQPETTLYVGDSDVDLETARNAGVDCASVCWGFQSEDRLKKAGATTLIANPLALVPLVLGTKYGK